MNCCYSVVYWTYRAFFCCSRLFARPAVVPLKKYNSIHPSNAPWLWIGAEMTNGKIITVTDEINKHIEYDDIINSVYLEEAANLKQGVTRWLYLDSKTLNEQEFPPEGLVITNDSVESATS